MNIGPHRPRRLRAARRRMPGSALVLIAAILGPWADAATVDERLARLRNASDRELAMVTTLSRREAEVILEARRGQGLGLDGIRNLTDEVGSVLARHDGPLSMNGLTHVPREFLGREPFTSLNGVATFDGESLRRHLSAAPRFLGPVSLGGLTVMTADQLDILLGSDGSLWLNRLEDVTEDPASGPVRPRTRGGDRTPVTRFEAMQGTTLSCVRLARLSPSVAAILASEPRTLLLDGLSELGPEAARALSRHAGKLSLDGLRTISEESAELLANHRGAVSLAGLTSLTSARLAATLARDLRKDWGDAGQPTVSSGQDLTAFASRARGKPVVGPALRVLTAEVAAALAAGSGELRLDGLQAIDLRVSRALSPHAGPLSLDGIAAVSDDVAESLADHVGTLSLAGLERLSSRRLAAKLAATPAQTCLPRLRELDAGVAAELAAQEGELILDGITTLSVAAAQALAPHVGTVRLNGLAAVSDELAAVLAGFRGTVELKGVATLSDDAIAVLLKNSGIRLPQRFLPASAPEAEDDETDPVAGAGGVPSRRAATASIVAGLVTATLVFCFWCVRRIR